MAEDLTKDQLDELARLLDAPVYILGVPRDQLDVLISMARRTLKAERKLKRIEEDQSWEKYPDRMGK